MIVLRCTRRLLALLGGSPAAEVPESTAALGDWYANVVPTVAGDLVVFANERTLLSVAVPLELLDRLPLEFPARAHGLLRGIGVPTSVALQECAELETVVLARTASRSVLGSLNEIALHFQVVAERDRGRGRLNLEREELHLSRFLHGPLGYVYPAEVATALLAERYGKWTQDQGQEEASQSSCRRDKPSGETQVRASEG